MTEPDESKCPHSWCTGEQVTVCLMGGQTVAHQGPAQMIQAADDRLSFRPVALPGHDLPPEEEILAELEVTVLTRPGVRRTSHVLLTGRECDAVVTALTAVRANITDSLTKLVAISPAS